MSDVVVIDKMPQFKNSMESVFNDALKEGARDIIIAAKTRAPLDKGQLRADSDVSNPSHLKWRISFWKEYARFQEFGGDATRRVRHYTTSGTGKAYLSTAGNNMRLKLDGIFKKHAQRARVW